MDLSHIRQSYIDLHLIIPVEERQKACRYRPRSRDLQYSGDSPEHRRLANLQVTALAALPSAKLLVLFNLLTQSKIATNGLFSTQGVTTSAYE